MAMEPLLLKQAAVLIALWLNNVAINMFNKWVLGTTDFRYPLTLTAANKTAGWLVITALVAASDRPTCGLRRLVTHHMRRPVVHVLGVLNAINIGTNNWSLVFIPLSINQLIKSSTPLPTALLSTHIQGKAHGWQLYASMLLLLAGPPRAAEPSSYGRRTFLYMAPTHLPHMAGAAIASFEKHDVSAEGAPAI